MVLLEGGYNLASISAGAEACVQTLLGDRAALPHDTVPTAEGLSSIAAAAISLQPFWGVQPTRSPSFCEVYWNSLKLTVLPVAIFVAILSLLVCFPLVSGP